MKPYRILYIDDRPETFDISQSLGAEEFCIVECKNEVDYHKHLQSSERFHGAIVDYRLESPFSSYKDGVELTKTLRRRFPEMAIIALSRYTTPSGQLKEILRWLVAGANYFWEKGAKQFDAATLDQVRHVLRFGAQQVERWGALLAVQIDPRDFPEFTKAPIPLERIAALPSPVLITGETGTGKESVARMIHSLGPRREKPIVTINCSAIPGTLLESELFGYEKGAFTGASGSRKGKVEIGEGGTVFLDEIGELGLEQQPKLLRLIQDQEIQRLGSAHSIKVDVRVIAATNRDLASMVAARNFREDLYYRLNVLPIHVQPLRERLNDFPKILERLVKIWNHNFRNDPEIQFAADAIDYLKPDKKNYLYPGNIRELENRVQRIFALAESHLLTKNDICKIEARYAAFPIPALVKEGSADRVALEGNDQYADQMAKIIDSLIPDIGKSHDLKSLESVVECAHSRLRKSHQFQCYTTHHILKLVAARHPETRARLDAALEPLRGRSSKVRQKGQTSKQ